MSLFDVYFFFFFAFLRLLVRWRLVIEWQETHGCNLWPQSFMICSLCLSACRIAIAFSTFWDMYSYRVYAWCLNCVSLLRAFSRASTRYEHMLFGYIATCLACLCVILFHVTWVWIRHWGPLGCKVLPQTVWTGRQEEKDKQQDFFLRLSCVSYRALGFAWTEDFRWLGYLPLRRREWPPSCLHWRLKIPPWDVCS